MRAIFGLSNGKREKDKYISGCIKFSNHCRDRMIERNVTVDDILYVIMWGDVGDLPRFSGHSKGYIIK